MRDLGHTPEPWHVDAIRQGTVSGPRAGLHDLKEHVATCYGAAYSNAARIVACVNYCAGVPAERLTEDSLEEKLEHIDRLTQQLAEAIECLTLTEGNLARLVAARHSNAVLMTPWLEVVRGTLAHAQGRP